MTKSDYEKLLKRIEGKLGDSTEKSSTRFELPVVDVMWEGQKTFLRNFSEFYVNEGANLIDTVKNNLDPLNQKFSIIEI